MAKFSTLMARMFQPHLRGGPLHDSRSLGEQWKRFGELLPHASNSGLFRHRLTPEDFEIVFFVTEIRLILEMGSTPHARRFGQSAWRSHLPLKSRRRPSCGQQITVTSQRLVDLIRDGNRPCRTRNTPKPTAGISRQPQYGGSWSRRAPVSSSKSCKLLALSERIHGTVHTRVHTVNTDTWEVESRASSGKAHDRLATLRNLKIVVSSLLSRGPRC